MPSQGIPGCLYTKRIERLMMLAWGLQVCSKARRKRPAAYCSCFDDFDCFQPAQQNLLHTIAAAHGCVVVLTGDFHFSDIKVFELNLMPV